MNDLGKQFKPYLDNDIHALTALRGLAAALIVAYHYRFYDILPAPASTIVSRGYLCVDLFFILSGFVMALTYGKVFSGGFRLENYRAFLGKRFARLYPVYIFFSIVTVAFYNYGLLDADQPPVLNAEAIISNLTLTQAWIFLPSTVGPAWSISTEWLAYFLFPVLALLCLYRGRLLASLTGVVCVLLLAVIAYCPESLSHITHFNGPLDVAGNADAGSILRCISEFSLGMLTWRICQIDWMRHFAASNKSGYVVALVALVVFAFPNTDLALVLIFSVLIASLTDNKSSLARLLSRPFPMWLGDISYSVYLVHSLLLRAQEIIQVQAEALHIPHSYTLSRSVAYFAIFGIATATFRYIELPARKKLRNLFEKKPTPINGLYPLF